MTKLIEAKGTSGRCRNCGNPFIRKLKNHQFCCDNCRKEFWSNSGVAASKIERIVETQLSTLVPVVESRLAKKFADILRKYRQKVPAELQQMADGNTTNILYSARCMCGEQFSPGSALFFTHVQGCKVIARP
jgi:ribosomal protein L37AE/L43A